MGNITNEYNNNDIIKCNHCGHVLVLGSGATVIVGSGTSIECRKCGNKCIISQKKHQDSQTTIFSV
jgi:DNA-directed RNA polymerase subunit RPC12/RpoP